MSSLSFAFNLRPEDAVRYLDKKGERVSGSWVDFWQHAHDESFTIANVAHLDVLQDIHGMITDALSNGQAFNEFKNNIIPALKTKGWYGQGFGEDGRKLIAPRRLDLIYRQNMQTSYSAGRYKGLSDNADARPYWRYNAIMDSRTRPAHAALNGKVFRLDNPFWDSMYPPNGFNCRCTVDSVPLGNITSGEYPIESDGGPLPTQTVMVGPADNRYPAKIAVWTDPVTGAKVKTDPGFNYNPGKVNYKPDLSKYEKSFVEQFKRAAYQNTKVKSIWTP